MIHLGSFSSTWEQTAIRPHIEQSNSIPAIPLHQMLEKYPLRLLIGVIFYPRAEALNCIFLYSTTDKRIFLYRNLPPPPAPPTIGKIKMLICKLINGWSEVHIHYIEGVVCGLFVYEVIYHTSPGNFPNTTSQKIFMVFWSNI